MVNSENSKQSMNLNAGGVTNKSFWEIGSNIGIFKQASKNSP